MTTSVPVDVGVVPGQGNRQEGPCAAAGHGVCVGSIRSAAPVPLGRCGRGARLRGQGVGFGL